MIDKSLLFNGLPSCPSANNYENVTLHFLGELNSEVTYLGSMAYIGFPSPSILICCPRCGEITGKIISQIEGRGKSLYAPALATCADCGGDNSLLFSRCLPLFGEDRLFNKISEVPQLLAQYELNCLAVRQGRQDKDLNFNSKYPQFGELL